MTRRRSRGRPLDQHAALQPAWYRVDLHLHTPGSGDYQEPRAGYLDLLQRAEARGLDIIAFTDHNSVAGYAAMQREIEHLEFLEASARLLSDEARRLHEYRRLRERILVLPGFEFTATFGFHILGIFPPETTVRKLEHILLELNIPEEKLDKGASEVGATTDVLRAYEIIAGAGGLVIGAHVNSTHGIAMIGLGFGGQTKIAYTQDPNLHALEVTDLESTSRRATSRFFNGSKPEYARRMHCIQGSDAHRVAADPLRPEKNLGIGDRCTEVLLPEPSFAALKALFASTDFSRTRPARAPEEHPFDPLTAAREEGATIVQAFQDTPGLPRVRVKGILKDIVAFANTNGGVIYVGASASPKDPIRGVEGADELSDLIRGESARQIVPPLTPDVETLKSEDKTVLVVTVPKGTETPYALEPGYIYVRQEGETALALRDEIVQLVRAAMAPATVGLDPGSTLPPRRVFPQRRVALVAEPEAEPVPAQPEPPAPVASPPAPVLAPQIAQQVAVQQATAAEQERQQERTPVPRTGVEVIGSVERNGLIYHTVRDLRNRRVVRNVTRESARRLWRYAILQVEQHTIGAEEVRWDERDSRFGFWKGYRQPEGMRRYNLVYREPAGGRNAQGGTETIERLRVFYGVTEDGIDERWRAVLPPDSELTDIYYDEPTLPGEPVPQVEVAAGVEATAPPDSDQSEPQPALELSDIILDTLPFLPVGQSVEPLLSAPDIPVLDATLDTATEPAVAEQPEVSVEAPAPRRRNRGRGGRRAAQPDVNEVAPELAVLDAAEVAEPTEQLRDVGVDGAEARPQVLAPAEETTPPDVAAVAESPAPSVETVAAPKRRRAPRRAKVAVEAEAPAPTEASAAHEQPAVASQSASESASSPEGAPADAPAPDDAPVVAAPARRRRAPRKAAAPPADAPTPTPD